MQHLNNGFPNLPTCPARYSYTYVPYRDPRVFIYMNEWWMFNGFHVGKYASPMDPTGGNIHKYMPYIRYCSMMNGDNSSNIVVETYRQSVEW